VSDKGELLRRNSVAPTCVPAKIFQLCTWPLGWVSGCSAGTNKAELLLLPVGVGHLLVLPVGVGHLLVLQKL